jgi:hypothetical protein
MTKVTNKRKTYKTHSNKHTKKNTKKIVGNTKYDFNKVKILKKLGAGMIGTTYLVTLNDKQYAMKIQHILANDIKESYKSQIWREIDLYNYINKLNNIQKSFFTELYNYEIYNNCKHIQIRDKYLELQHLDDKFKKFKYKYKDYSDWCIKFLINYKGDENLFNFLIKNLYSKTISNGNSISNDKITKKQIYSICLQLCNIIYILYLGGYSHNDFHLKNLMIQKTSNRSFKLMNYDIPFLGYQISAIDYDRVIHKKFNKKNINQDFLYNREQYMFREIFNSTILIFDSMYKLVDDNFVNKIKTYEKNFNQTAFKKIINENPEFYTTVKSKYSKSFPQGKQFFNIVENTLDNDKLFFDKIKTEYQWDIYNRIVKEFLYLHPEKYFNYYKLNNNVINISDYKMGLDTETLLDILNINNYKNYIKYFAEKIKMNE